PAKANNLVSIYVHRLRRLIGDTEGRVLVYRAPGYQLRIGTGDLDLDGFESLVAEGRSALAADDPVRAATLLDEALRLWRGPLLADVAETTLIATEAERTQEMRLTATELRIEAALVSGRAAQVIAELRRLVAENPIREGLWLLLMRALDESGRHAEALDTYTQARQVISGELGVDPGAELQRLYARLLAADASSAPPRKRPRPAGRPRGARPVGATPGGGTDADIAGALAPGLASAAGAAGAAAAADDSRGAGAAAAEMPGSISIGMIADAAAEPAGTEAAAAGPAVADEVVTSAADFPVPHPAQLPADIGDFTGRDAQVRLLSGMLVQDAGTGSPGAVRMAVVAGAAGLGKTTLAVHAAHQVSEHFPDGQLYVDLRGASAQAAAPGEVLARFLRDLGIDGDKVPVGDDERAALYRTRLTGRRVLIVLDNARDTAQVRPLLPGSASCAVLMTTRNRTPDLASTKFVDLNVLEDTEALMLFSRIVDDDRPAAEPDATAEVLLACAGLPLAIRICAARLAARRQWRVATLASRLRDEHRRLDELTTGDLAVRASFQVSYDSLRAGRYGIDPAHVFRLLGLWQGASISLPAAGALLGGSEDDVADALETLVDANLLESPAADWYRFHDLLRFYATERAEE
ncbi:MAG TPA: BTAD domain-containing putative transcriptional regulator, partial [Trebonia sp.]|nr:BTAD domain-containing putative transcriptional regulator [Trebonia sp.]